MRLMIAGGGTGGHLFPGIALAQAWIARAPEPDVFFVGTAQGLEGKVVPQAGFRLHLIDQRGLKRLGLVKTIKALFMLPKSFFQSLRLVWRERPNAVLGVGGYAAGPAVLAAALFGAPIVLLEPNAVLGLTNRLLAWAARKIVSPYALANAGAKLLRAGIPVRREIIVAMQKVAARPETPRPETPRPETPRPETSRPAETPTVLIFGGSQGARAINQVVAAAAPRWVREHGIRVIHQTGPADFAATKAAYAQAGVDIDVREFIHDMAAAYGASDLVICRAGGSSLAELGLTKKPAILVPLPTAADDHQTKNAEAVAALGAAVHVPQRDLDPDRLTALVTSLLNDKQRLAAMAAAMAATADPDAAEKLCELCLSLARKERA